MKTIKGTIARLLLAITVILPAAAHAEFVRTDWKVEGDQNAFLDTETDTQWLKLTKTLGMSINEVSAELGVGGEFEGWRLPHADEVETLLGNMFGSLKLNEGLTHYFDEKYTGYGNTWRAWFGYRYLQTGSSNFGTKDWISYAVYQQDDQVLLSGTHKDYGAGGGSTWTKTHIYDDWSSTSYTLDYSSASVGVFLVQGGDVKYITNVSAPSGIIAALTGMFMFSFRRKKLN